jgi:ATP-dependent protease HslVU (ClpYQ) peptidase subunit
MSLVISTEEAGHVLMGADSAAGSAEEVHVFPDLEKIIRRGPYLVGHCGRALVGQALSVLAKWPEPPKRGEELLPFLVREVVPEIRRAVRDAGAAAEGPGILGDKTVLLVGLHGQLFAVGADLFVVKAPGLFCIGAGRPYAYPTMKALKAAGVEPARKRIEMTLKAAAEECPLVRPPFRFLESE